MWPRLIAQMVELLPHVTRLVPIADNYFSSKSASERSHSAALNAMGESLRGDLGSISVSCTTVSQQLAEQTVKIAALHQALDWAQADAITQGRQMEWMVKDLNSLRVWIKFGVSTIVLLLIAIAALGAKLLLMR